VNYEKLAIKRFFLEDDVKNLGKKKKISADDVNFKFYKISDCPILSAFTLYSTSNYKFRNVF
jgi:hypothetical protein